MEVKAVPQDKVSTYAGHRKLMYATDDQGSYTTTTSYGWETEAFANKQAVYELKAGADEAYALVKAGKKSPLYFYMYYYRHDLISLAQSSGFFQWRVKRHLLPQHFNKLSLKQLQRYASAFNLSPEQLKTLPNL